MLYNIRTPPQEAAGDFQPSGPRQLRDAGHDAFINGAPNPTAGRITRTRTPGRQTQLGVRWTF